MTVLIGYLPAPEGDKALATGIAEAKLRGTKAVVVNSPRKGAHDRWSTLSADRLQQMNDLAAAHGVEIEIVQPEHEGSLTAVLNSLAESYEASVLVIGMRKRNPLGKLVLGSQAEHILMESHIPVLTVTAVSHDGD